MPILWDTFSCPKCKSTDVRVTILVGLDPNDPSAELEIDDRMAIGPDSAAHCRACDWMGIKDELDWVPAQVSEEES